MELYKLQLNVTLVRYNAEPKEQQKRVAEAFHEANRPGGDPQAAMATMLDTYLDRVNGPSAAPELPEAQIAFRRTYDVAADSLQDAAAFCKQFEAVAEGLGVPSAPMPDLPPLAFPARRGF